MGPRAATRTGLHVRHKPGQLRVGPDTARDFAKGNLAAWPSEDHAANDDSRSLLPPRRGYRDRLSESNVLYALAGGEEN